MPQVKKTRKSLGRMPTTATNDAEQSSVFDVQFSDAGLLMTDWQTAGIWFRALSFCMIDEKLTSDI
jgi:hypothetical protein